MKPMRVLLTDGLQESGIKLLNSVAEVKNKKGISAQELLEEIGKFDAVIVRGRTTITGEILAKAKNLKVIGRCGVGVDNIDVEEAEKRGIIVVNAPCATTISVAEHTMGLIYALAREIPRADAGMKNGRWLKKELMGIEINRKSLGIIGYGRIGQRVARLAASAGMKIVVQDRRHISSSILVEVGEEVTFDEMMSISDFITIHTPLSDSTRNLIDAAAISKMKDGVRIICAARGGIIDEKALLDGLNSGKIAGAALDVFANEPHGGSDLVNHPCVIATPHIAGQTCEAQIRASDDIAREVIGALNGEKLRWQIV